MHVWLRKANTSYAVTIPKDIVEILELSDNVPLKLTLRVNNNSWSLQMTPAEVPNKQKEKTNEKKSISVRPGAQRDYGDGSDSP